MKADRKNVMSRQRWILALLCVLLSVGVTVGAVFALTRLVYKSDTQTIVASNVYFKVNDRTFRDTIESRNLTLTRGESRDLDLAVKFISGGSESAVEYNAELRLDADNADKNELARAIEVYRKTEAGYEFAGMLSELAGNGFTARGMAVANQEATVESFRFVYSPAAGDYYETQTFALTASVTGEVKTSTILGNVVYVNTLTQLTASTYAGKTVRLMKDVELTEDLTVDAPMLLDLNGYTLTVKAGQTLTVNYGDAAEGNAYAGYKSLSGIINSKAGGGLAGGGALTVTSCGSDLYLLGDGLTVDGALTVTAPAAPSVKGFFDAAAYNYEKFVKGNTYAAEGVVPLLANLGYYLDKISFEFASDALEFNSADKTVKALTPEMTNNYAFALTGNDGNETFAVRGGVTVRGSSAYAVANAYLDAIPQTIRSSLFLPTFDRASGLSLTWITDDGNGGNAFDDDGSYLKNGLNALNDWTDKAVRIRLVAGNNDAGDNNSDAVGNYYTEEITRRAEILDAERRTDKIYTAGQIILEENKTYAFADYFAVDYFSQGENAVNKTNITDIAVSLGTEGAKYVVVTGEKLATALSVAAVPDKTSVGFEISVTFTYGDVDPLTGQAANKTYTFDKSVIVLGYTESVTLKNAQSTIQSWLDDTAYAKNGGGDYDLSVLSYLSGTGDLVEYSLPGYVDYVFVRDGEYVKNAGGRYFLTDDGAYEFFAAYYRKATEEEIAAGDYAVELNGAHYNETDDKNNAFIIAGGQAYSYDGGKRCYDRTAVFSVLPEKVPPYDVDVNITAHVYRPGADGKTKLYCLSDGSYAAEGTAANPRVEYTVTLTVRGVFHNNADEIYDSSVYAKLLEYYDLDGDGYISRTEARAEWLGPIYDEVNQNWYYFLSTDGVTPAGSKTYSSPNIDLSGLNISSLKGLEYFTNARGYYLANNAVADLSPLAQLNKLESLELSSNYITDISALAYLDNLQTIGLSYNNITDISALEYLKNLSMISLAGNAIDDFLPLSEHKNISYLNVQGNSGVGTPALRYAFSLIYENNKSNAGFVFFVYENPYTENSDYYQKNPYNAERIANATALRRLNEIGQVYRTLHLPTEAGGKTVTWSCNSGYIGIGAASGGYYTYSIQTPPVDTYVTLSAHVGSGDAEVIREITVLLLSDRTDAGSNDVYVQTGNDAFVLMNDVVPDKTLRALLFNLINTKASETFTIGGKPISGLRVLTLDEINKYVGSKDIQWQSGGITDLTGIEYFAPVFAGATLDLSGNEITAESGLKPLAGLTGLKGLTLGGREYDFTQLLGADGNPGLTALETLAVYECYNLAGDKVLASLYRVYLANPSVSIYKDSKETVWNPYAEPLARYVRSLPSFYAFMDVGDSYPLLGKDGFCEFDFYGVKTIRFTVKERTISGVNNYSDDKTTTNITLQNAAARDTTSYARYTLQGSDGRNGVENNVTYNNYYVELLAENNTRFAVDFKNGSVTPLSNVFTGYTIRAAVLKQLYASTPAADIAAAKGNGSYCVVPLEKFKVMDITSITVDGTYESNDPLGGLQYLEKLTTLTLSRDANLGNGSGLKQIETLNIKYSFINFSSISTPLPKLKNLLIYGSNTSPVFYKKNANASYYELIYGGETYLVPDHDYYLRWFTGLETLTLDGTKENGGFDSTGNKISDWTFLFGLLFADDGSGQKLNVDSSLTTGLTYNGQSVKHNLATLKAYNNKNTYVVSMATEAADGYNVLDLGTLNGSVSGTFKLLNTGKSTETYDNAVGFGIAAALFRASTAAAPSYYLLNADTKFSMTDFTYSFKVDPAKEYAEFNAAVTETGARIKDGALLSQLEDQSVTGNTTISLPLTTYAYTGTDFGDDNYFTRAFGIRWSLYGWNNRSDNSSHKNLSVTGADDLMTGGAHLLGFPTFTYNFSAAPSLNDYRTATLDLTLSPTKDYYLLVVGTIGEYYYDNKTGQWETFASAQTIYTYVYPLLIKTAASADDATSFARIEDTALRFILFTECADPSYCGNLFCYSTTVEKVSWNYNTSGTFSNYDKPNRTPTKIFANPRTSDVAILNLTGLDALASLTSFAISGMPLANIDALGLLPNLSSVSISKCGITYLPSLPESVTSVALSQNSIRDISAWQNSVYPKLTTLNLEQNDITANMLQYFYDPNGLNHIPAVKTLNLKNNYCSSDYAMIEWAYLLTQSGTTVTSLNDWTVNAKDLTSLRTALGKFEDTKKGSVFGVRTYDTATKPVWDEYCASVARAGKYEYSTLSHFTDVMTNNNVSLSFANLNVKTVLNSSYIKSLTLSAKVYPSDTAVPSCWLSSSAPLWTTVEFYHGGKSDLSFKGASSSAATYASSEFDGNLVAYLYGTGAGSASTDSVYTLKNYTLSVTTDYGLTSLKGANYLYFNTIKIENNILLSKLWEGDFSSLTSLTLADCSLSSNELKCLENASACKTLNLMEVRGVDYENLGNALINVTNLSTDTHLFGKSKVSARRGYIDLLNGATIGGFAINNASSLTVRIIYRSSDLTASYYVRMYNSALAYFYEQSFEKFSAINILLEKNSIYQSDNFFYTLADKADFGAIFTYMDGSTRTNATSGEVRDLQKLPIGKDVTISYNDLSNPMIYKLPVSIDYGSHYTVTWRVFYGDNDVSSTFMTGNTFTLSAVNIDKLNIKSETASLTLRAVISDSIKSLTKDGIINLSDIKASSSSGKVDAIDYDYYVEIDADGNCKPANEIFASGRFIEWIFGGTSGIGGTKDYNNIVYYNGNYFKDGGKIEIYGQPVTVNKGWGIAADQVDASVRTFRYGGETLNDSANAVVLTYEFCQSLYALDTTTKSSAGNSMGITSLKGIEYFANLKEIYFVAGNFTDISPLQNMELSLFSYQNANGADAAASYISDFSPLVAGRSRDTLEVFVYDSYAASMQVTDLSFLTAFKNLKEAYLFGSSPYSGYSVPDSSLGSTGTSINLQNLVQYLEAPSFSYLVSALDKQSARLYLGAGAATKMSELLNGSIWTGYYDSVTIEPTYDAKYTKKSGYKAYELRPKDSPVAAAALASFDKPGSPYYTVDGGYSLTLNGIKSADVTAANGFVTVSAKLPAVLASGYLYAIDWQTGSTRLEAGGYGITGSLTVGGVTYDATHNVFASYADFADFLKKNEAAVYNGMNSGTFGVYVNVSLTLPAAADADGNYVRGTYQSFVSLLLRAEVNGVAYERMLSVDIDGTLAGINKTAI